MSPPAWVGLGWLCGGEYLISPDINDQAWPPDPVRGIPAHCAHKNLFFLPFGSCCGHQELQVCVGTSRMCSLCSGPSPSLITLRDQDAARPGQVSDPQLCTTI